MIKVLTTISEAEMRAMLDLWLAANLDAHPFIEKEFWEAHLPEVSEGFMAVDMTVYEHKGEIQGLMGIVAGYVAGIFVAKAHRHQGIGTALLNDAKARYGTLTLAVYIKNDQAVTFYESQGFVVNETRLDKITDEMELVLKWQRGPI